MAESHPHIAIKVRRMDVKSSTVALHIKLFHFLLALVASNRSPPLLCFKRPLCIPLTIIKISLRGVFRLRPGFSTYRFALMLAAPHERTECLTSLVKLNGKS